MIDHILFYEAGVKVFAAPTYLLIPFFWTSLTLKYVLFCTVSGSVAEWWFHGKPAWCGFVETPPPPSPLSLLLKLPSLGHTPDAVAHSLHRALSSSSFRSIVYGTTVIAGIKVSGREPVFHLTM